MIQRKALPKQKLNRKLITSLRTFLLFGTSLLLANTTLAKPQQTVFLDATENLPAAPDAHTLGSTIVDIDDDGDNDIIVAVEHGRNRFYRNDGTGNFEDVSDAFVDRAHDSEHVEAADFNADGILDLIFVAEDDREPELYFGTKNGGFQNVSERLPQKSEANALAVADVNRDNFPDIFVGNTSEKRDGNNERANAQNLLWLNNSEQPGTFSDVSQTHLPQRNDQTQGIALGDVDGDGDLDAAIANQEPPNTLLINDGNGVFDDAEQSLDLSKPLETRQAYLRDFNGDNVLDLLLFNLTSNNHDWSKDPQTRLLIGDGTGNFADETEERIPHHTTSVYSGIPVDLNQDGNLDFISGPIVIPGFVPQQVRAYINDGKGYFSDRTDKFIPEETVGLSWGISAGDLNGDGKPDLFIGGWGTQARLLLSTTSE